MHVVHSSWWLAMFCGPSLSDGFILQFCILEAGYKNVITKFVERRHYVHHWEEIITGSMQIKIGQEPEVDKNCVQSPFQSFNLFPLSSPKYFDCWNQPFMLCISQKEKIVWNFRHNSGPDKIREKWRQKQYSGTDDPCNFSFSRPRWRPSGGCHP